MNQADTHWADKTCLVTGAYGFVGTHLCRRLIDSGAKVVALDYLPDVQGTYFGLLGLERHATLLRADVRRSSELQRLRDYEFDVVFHLAAQPISPLSNLLPEDTIETNAAGTANVGVAVAAQPRPPVFVLASSACWYGATTTSPLTEEDVYVQAEFKYSESKVLAERAALKLEARMPTIRCRFVNLYGAGDRHFSRVVPKTLRHLIKGEQPSLSRNNGATVLDFMHVADAVQGLLLAAGHGASIRGEVFNFGIAGENPRPTFELVKLIAKLFDGRAQAPIIINASEPRTKAKYLDSTKARQRLGWQPSIDLEAGLNSTISWYRDNLDCITHLKF